VVGQLNEADKFRVCVLRAGRFFPCADLFRELGIGSRVTHTAIWMAKLFGWLQVMTAGAATGATVIWGYIEHLSNAQLFVLGLGTFAVVLVLFNAFIRLADRVPLPKREKMGFALLIIGAVAVVAGLALLQSAQDQGTSHSGGTAIPNNQSQTPYVNITGGDNVVSIGQISGITARVVNINPPITPELRILGTTEIDNPNGTHTVNIDTEVVAPFAPGLLAIQINADGLQNAMIAPPAAGGISSIQLRNSFMSNNYFSAEIPGARGRYIISVTTTKPTEIKLSASF
jgi:hypothetical protein